MQTLSRENIVPRVLTIISECLGIKRAELTEADSISDFADSLDYLEIWQLCEDEFEVELGDETSREVGTIAELVDLIMAQSPSVSLA